MIEVHPILHVGRFARVVTQADRQVPSATHVVTSYLGLTVHYWRRYKQGWRVTTLGPEWWE